MTSTLLDATLCVLLVSASVVTLTTVPAERRSPSTRIGDADATAETLATSTATVNYTLAPGARLTAGGDVTFPTREGPAFCRTVHGTLAALVADAAMGRVEIGGERLTHARDDLAAGVRDAVRVAVGGTHTQVVGVWSPYPGAPVRGVVTIGRRPAPDADVHAATVVASSGAPAARRTERPDEGYGPVARTVARRTVGTLFPPEAMRFALGADYPTSRLVRRRYVRAGRLLGVDVTDEVRRRQVRAANRRLTAALTPRVEHDLRREFDSPRAAARAVAIGRVRIVVRRWSA